MLLSVTCDDVVTQFRERVVKAPDNRRFRREEGIYTVWSSIICSYVRFCVH